jgi:hypothetical protein
MSEADKGGVSQPRKLALALREARSAMADKSDVVVDMKEADKARLDLLAEALVPVFSDVPADHEQFDFAVSSGVQPRLWIDATTHVMMGRDRRTYRLVRDTRLGRIVLAESGAVDPVANAVTSYIAERIVERERMLDGPSEPIAGLVDTGPDDDKAKRQPPTEEKGGWGGFMSGLGWFVVGTLAGALFFYALVSDTIKIPGLDF